MLTNDPNQPPQMDLLEVIEKAPVEVKDSRDKVPTVSEVTRRLRGHIENTFFDVWVKGEISNFKKPASGHAYFILKDATAQLRCCFFKPQISKLKFQLQDGVEILLHGKVTVYEARGDYQLLVDTAEPVGVGALQLAFEQLKRKLAAEGLFQASRKKKLPILPKRVGIITSATGAAVKDILKVLSRRFPEREILIFPASVQGEKAAPEIVNALKMAVEWNTRNPARLIEVLIVGRGGGSLEDLWPFNEEIVARAIAACPIPTISAVGHEIDYTIADFVADLRAPTPSAAAEIVLPKKDELVFMVNTSVKRLALTIRKRFEQWRMHCTHLASRLVSPQMKLKEIREKFKRLDMQLHTAFKHKLAMKKQKMASQVSLLQSFNPLKVLERGYSVTSQDGHVLTSIQAVSAGALISTRLKDGQIHSRVEKIETST